jgi:hypothetical protein
LLGEVYALHAAFGSYAHELASERRQHLLYSWFPFSLPSTVTPDHDRSRLAAARELARSLSRAGLPTRARLTMNTAMRFLMAMTSVLALGWDLCDWQLARLAQHPELREQTATAMHEAVRLVVPARSPFLLLPRFAFATFLRAFPWLMSKRARTVWLLHGPKIRAQTDYVVRELLAKGSEQGAPSAALRSLFERWRSAIGPGR